MNYHELLREARIEAVAESRQRYPLRSVEDLRACVVRKYLDYICPQGALDVLDVDAAVRAHTTAQQETASHE